MEDAVDAIVPSSERFCICYQVNDGSPYVQCDICQQWFHFKCVGLPSSPHTTDRVKRDPFRCKKCLPTVSRGIKNIGNSCWFASTVQAVKVTHVGHILKNRSNSNNAVGEMLTRILRNLEEKSCRPIGDRAVRQAVQTIADEVRGPFLNCQDQQDASEFFSNCILDNLHQEYVANMISPVTTTFATEIVTCLNCGNEEKRNQSLPMLTITPHRPEVVKNIAALFEDEVRDGICCSECRERQLKGYSYEIAKLPPCLVVNINRTQRDGNKCNSSLDSIQRMIISSSNVHFEDTTCSPYYYQLISAVVHRGQDKGGHYYTYVFKNGSVFQLNDESVQNCTTENAVADIALNGILLFYELSENLDTTGKVEISNNDESDFAKFDTNSPTVNGYSPQDVKPNTSNETCQQQSLQDETNFFIDSVQQAEGETPISDATLADLSASPIFKRFYEVTIPTSATFKIDEDAWTQLRKEQKGTRLPLQWVNVFYDGLRKSNPFCTLMFKRHRVAKQCSRKTSSIIFSASAYCCRRPTCNVSATLSMDENLICSVQYYGRVKHTTNETAQRPIRAEERLKLQNELWNNHCPSRKNMENLKEMDDSVFASGNLTGVGADSSTFKQISYEGRRRLQSDKDLITSLLVKEKLNLKNYIRQISAVPSYVITFTDAGVRLFHEMAPTVPLHWDATGSVAWKARQ
ncbi:hypothetical protein BSL78_02337 [Apostichopus japonicus]|uniref:Uncharacterized protein n=1 Tax=Stichopus japonicus TaxID=307972 RepID=A0A2G8LKJ4_STIJA|nr:hypothetical protein BSL78_02337 [Apostichopus japonicus]